MQSSVFLDKFTDDVISHFKYPTFVSLLPEAINIGRIDVLCLFFVLLNSLNAGHQSV